MVKGRECWDCFYGNPLGMGEYKCNKTGRRTKGDSSCGDFIPDDAPNVHACWECEYFGTYKACTIFEKKNYCEKKGKVMNPDGLACPYFHES